MHNNNGMFEDRFLMSLSSTSESMVYSSTILVRQSVVQLSSLRWNRNAIRASVSTLLGVHTSLCQIQDRQEVDINNRMTPDDTIY